MSETRYANRNRHREGKKTISLNFDEEGQDLLKRCMKRAILDKAPKGETQQGAILEAMRRYAEGKE